MSRIRLLLCLAICTVIGLPLPLHGKIRLFTFHYNRPDFLEIQCRCLNKFLKEKDDYELIVFNDALDQNFKTQIEDVCKKYDVQCVTFPQELHHKGRLIDYIKKWSADGTSGSVRHCQLVQYALENYGFDHDDIVGMFEGDVFLIKEFSIREALKDYDIISAIQTDRENLGYEFLWIGLNFFKVSNLPNKRTLNFDVYLYGDSSDNLLDSGGCTYFYLKDNPSLRLKKYYRTPISSLLRHTVEQLSASGFTAEEIDFLHEMAPYTDEHPFVSSEFHFDRHFLHYSWSRYNWGQDFKYIAFHRFLESILQ